MKPNVSQQLTQAVLIARKNELTNTRVKVRCQGETPELVDILLPLSDTGALRGLEVWVTDHSGSIEGVVGDHRDGRKNVIFAIDSDS